MVVILSFVLRWDDPYKIIIMVILSTVTRMWDDPYNMLM